MTKLVFVLLIFTFQNIEARTNLFRKDPEADKKAEVTSEALPQVKKKRLHPVMSESNLPDTYSRTVSSISIEESPVVIPTLKSKILFGSLKPGDLLQVEISESLFAFAESKTPVRAIVSTGPLKGAILIGEANLEKHSKRIGIRFKQFRTLTNEVFSFDAVALDSVGILGLKGKLMSSDTNYFAAQIAAAAAAGYIESTITRDQNVFGNVTDSKSQDTFSKKALTSGLSKTSELLAEQFKQSSEYATLVGPISLQVLSLEQPFQNN